MPAAWSGKDERQYKHVVDSCVRRGRYARGRCRRIAGATVNKRRRSEGRSLSDVSLNTASLARPVFLAGLAAYLLWASKLRHIHEGTLLVQ